MRPWRLALAVHVICLVCGRLRTGDVSSFASRAAAAEVLIEVCSPCIAVVGVTEVDGAGAADEFLLELLLKPMFELECALEGAPSDRVLEAFAFVRTTSWAGCSGAGEI